MTPAAIPASPPPLKPASGSILVSAPNLARLRDIAGELGPSSTFDDVITYLLECRDGS